MILDKTNYEYSIFIRRQMLFCWAPGLGGRQILDYHQIPVFNLGWLRMNIHAVNIQLILIYQIL